ncbi:hypothetical protein D3C76_1411090 [compost metagenome]
MQGQREALAVNQQAAVLGLHQHHMVGAGGELQLTVRWYFDTLDLLHFHQAIFVHMLMQLGIVADRAVDTEQRIGGSTVVVDDEVGGDVRGVGRQFLRPRMGDMQITLGVFVGSGKGCRQQQGGQQQGVLEHGDSPVDSGSQQ